MAVGPTLRPKDVDAATRVDPVTLADLRAAMPAHVFTPTPWRSWAALARVLACAALGPLALSQVSLDPGPSLLWQVPAHLALWWLYGCALVGLFVLGHDCGHEAFTANRRVDWLVGHAVMAPLANGFHVWRVTHDQHHAHTQRRGQEVDWAAHLVTAEELAATSWRRDFMVRLGYALPFGVALWIGWNMLRRGFAVRSQLPPQKYQREKGRLRRSGAIVVISLTAIYGGLFHALGLWGMLKFYGIPATIAAAIGALIITIQHASEHTLLYSDEGWSPVRGQLVSTFDVRLPRWLEWMWCNINIHIPHHIAPRIPWYHLPEAGRALRRAYPGLYQEERMTLGRVLYFSETPLLREDTERGYFELVRPASSPASQGA